MIPAVAAIGTTHPYAVTGLLVELNAIRDLGARPLAIVAGVSAQTAASVLAVHAVDPAAIGAQFDAVLAAGVAAFSIGVLPSAAAVAAVAERVAAAGLPAICDPVLAATGGGRLVDDATVAALRELLFPHCTLLTPNLPEAEALLGRTLPSAAEMRAAIPALLALGPAAVLLKGGHLAGEPCDLFAAGGEVIELRAPRIAAELRGTGSLLAAAIATRCAFGDPLLAAVEAARTYVRERIAHGVAFAGMRVAF